MHIVNPYDILAEDSRTFDGGNSISIHRPSLTMTIDDFNRTGEFTNRSITQTHHSTYGGGFHTTKNRDVKLNTEIDGKTKRSVIEFGDKT